MDSLLLYLQNPKLLWILGACSILTVLMAFALLPVVINSLPPDYFVNPERPCNQPPSPYGYGVPGRGPKRLLMAIVKNSIGVLLLASGVLMLFIPGQGLLTIFAGLLLMNFPGKFQIERWIVTRPGILRGCNWIRAQKHLPPFQT